MSQMRIYVVDDDPDLLAVFEEMLRCRGDTPRASTDPWEIIQWTQDDPPDLIITDLDFKRSDIDGVKLAVIVHYRGFTGPILMVSGFALNRLPRYITRYLTKPVDLIELDQTIREVMIANETHLSLS